MNTFNLNNDDIKIFGSIHNTIISKRKNSFERKGLYYNKNPDKLIIEPIIKKTEKILDMFNKKNFDSSKYYIEFQQRNCGFEKKSKRTFDWHEDDYGAVNFKVYTVIYYLRKDTTIIGGDLEYIFEGKNYLQEIKNGQVLCFDGNLKHRPEICSGMGCRDSIVVFVKSNF